MFGDILSGAAAFGTSYIGGQKRLDRKDKAQGEFESAFGDYMSQDIGNMYSNMENPYEDLTVNTQQADFAAAQNAQGLSNIMGQNRQAAGGSGIAALAQSLAGMQAQGAQQASASIGMQEQRNQQMQARGAESIQNMERQGAERAMGRETDRLGTGLGMSQAELAASQADIQRAQMQRAEGIGQFAGGVGNVAGMALTGYSGDNSTMLALQGGQAALQRRNNQ